MSEITLYEAQKKKMELLEKILKTTKISTLLILKKENA